MRTSRIATALAAVCATALVPLAVVTTTAAAADSPHFSVKKLCRDDGSTRVRVLVKNDTDTAHEYSSRVVYPSGRERLYSTIIWEYTDRTIFDAVTVRPGTVVKFTIGAGGDDFTGVFGRRFSPLDC